MPQKDITPMQENNQSGVAIVCKVLAQEEGKASSQVYALEKATRLTHVFLRIAEGVKDEPALAHLLTEQSTALLGAVGESVSKSEARFASEGALRTLGALIDLLVLRGVLAREVGMLLAEELRLLAVFLKRHVWYQHPPLEALSLALSGEGQEGFFEEETRGREEVASLRAQVAQRFARVAGTSEHTALQEKRMHTPKERPTTTPVLKGLLGAQKDRRARILALLQTKPAVTVRDVAEAVEGCSEKTLQRELLALVAQGVLKKEGERRWSTYRLG